jgi:hypothetical protein
MIIYNVTVKIEKDVHEEWLQWMQSKHIPDVLNTGYFVENRILKVLTDDDDGFTYSIQYKAPSMEHYLNYQKTAAPALQKEHTDKYRNKFVAFRTLLEEV